MRDLADARKTSPKKSALVRKFSALAEGSRAKSPAAAGPAEAGHDVADPYIYFVEDADVSGSIFNRAESFSSVSTYTFPSGPCRTSRMR